MNYAELAESFPSKAKPVLFDSVVGVIHSKFKISLCNPLTECYLGYLALVSIYVIYEYISQSMTKMQFCSLLFYVRFSELELNIAHVDQHL